MTVTSQARERTLLIAHSGSLEGIKDVAGVDPASTVAVALDDDAAIALRNAGFEVLATASAMTLEAARRGIPWVNKHIAPPFLTGEGARIVSWDSVPLWGFIHPYVFSDIALLLDITARTKQAIDEVSPRRVVIAVNRQRVRENLAHAAISAVVRQYPQIEVVLAGYAGSAKIFLRALLRRIRVSLYRLEFRIAAEVVRVLAPRPHRKGVAASDRRATIALLTLPRGWMKSRDPIEGERLEDIYVHPIVRALRKRKHDANVLAIDTYYPEDIHSFRGLLKYLVDKEPFVWLKKCTERFKDDLVRWNTLHSYMNFRARRAAHRRYRQISAQWKRAFLNSAEGRLTFQGVDLADPVLSILGRYFRENLLDTLKIIEGSCNLIRKENIASALMVYETGPYGKAMAVAGSRLGVPTVGLQHGLIYDAHPDYTHAVVSADPARVPGIPIPTKTAVFGPHELDVLVESGHYPPSAVECTGQPRYDRLVELGEIPEAKTAARRDLGIPQDAKVLVFLSAGYESADEIEAVVTAAHDLDLFLLCKLHPNESGERITEALAALAATGRVIKHSLIESILAADLAITKASTTGIEAMILRTDLIVLNLSGQPDIISYAEDGAALGVYNKSDLRGALELLLNDVATRERITEGRDRYLGTRVSLSPPASERLADLLVQLSKQRPVHLS